MTFTDDEIRVLKGMCVNGNFPISGKELLPLLRRLECAEKVCYVLLNTRSINAAGAWDNLEAWRKAAGK